MNLIPLMMMLVVVSGMDQDAAVTDPADSRIVYSGRWDVSNSSQPWCAWQGSSIKAKFKGTGIRAEFDNGGNSDFLRIIVDGQVANSKKLKLSPNRQSYPLASELVPGEHQIEIVKETYSGKGRLTFHGFQISGDGLVAFTNSKPQLKIVFYGDSNLAGSSLEHEKNDGSPRMRGCYYSLAGIAARMLDAEYHNISVGGARIATGLNSGLSFYNRMDFYQPEPCWKSAAFPADVCVINLGANDVSAKSKDEIKKDYKVLVGKIRAFHPDAHIVLMNGYGWSRDEPANYTQEVVAEFGDPGISRVIFPWLFNEWHGCEYDHAGMAQVLVDHLVQLDPSYKQVRPSDVMNGFGQDGNVSNGSFELAAPFGGYGWRYFNDGAERVHDPQQSPAGEWFLRLTEGKQVHQPNPATKDKEYTVHVKMRGAADGNQCRIGFEFRDQEWRHEIPDSSKSIVKDLDTTWKEYKVTVKSPPGVHPPNASRDTWQIITRFESLSGTVDIDDVRLSTAK